MKPLYPNKKFTCTILIFTLSLFLAVWLDAQGGVYHKKQPNQVRFSVTTVFFEPLQIEHYGEPLLTSSPRLGGDASIFYSQRLRRGFRINGGIGWSIISYNYGYHFLIPPGSIFDSGSDQPDYFTTHGLQLHNDQAILFFPLSFQKLFIAKKNQSRQFNIELGCKLNVKQSFPYKFSCSHSSHVEGEGQVEYFHFDMESTGSGSFFSYFLKAGLVKFNNRYNSWHCNLVYQFSPAKIGTGNYYFNELEFESYGSHKQSVNYLGLEIIYGLTLSKKTLRA